MNMKESYYRLALSHFLKYSNDMLININDDDHGEEYEKIVDNAAWSETFYV